MDDVDNVWIMWAIRTDKNLNIGCNGSDDADDDYVGDDDDDCR